LLQDVDTYIPIVAIDVWVINMGGECYSGWVDRVILRKLHGEVEGAGLVGCFWGAADCGAP